MNPILDGNAIVYCQGAFNTTNGKTAHGLVRFTRRYRVLSVVDVRHQGKDAGEVLDGKPAGIPIFATLEEALQAARECGTPAAYFVFGVAPDGGRLIPEARQDILKAVQFGLHVDSGLHTYLSDDPEVSRLAAQRKVTLRDVRKPKPSSELHFFSGEIEEVTSFKVAVLGTDSAVGKRTTAWKLVDGLREKGYSAELVGTGQTAWMQGARFGVIMDSLINDFVAGEIEHVVWSAWQETKSDFIIIEGQGSLMNPAYPGGFEILAAGRPNVVVVQHPPARQEYDGFPGYKLHDLPTQIQAIELISGKPVVGITVNHEDLAPDEIPAACAEITRQTGLPAADVLVQGPGKIVNMLIEKRNQHVRTLTHR
ncbi:MAG: DUF1611 domain-containing protein [bacterium]